MSLAINANAVPSPQYRTAFLSVGNASALPAGNAPNADPIVLGQTVISGPLRRNATRTDLLGAYGGGGYAVALGLDLSAGSGLLVSVAPGHAVIDGIVEISQARTIAVPDDTALTWIWLQSVPQSPPPAPTANGTLIAVPTSLAPPAGSCCLLGAVVTSGGAVRAVDTSGVLYRQGMSLVRFTADTAQPTDSPPLGLSFLTVTASGGTWLWLAGTYYRLPTS